MDPYELDSALQPKKNTSKFPTSNIYIYIYIYMNNIFMAWLSPIHPPPVVFGDLKTPRPMCEKTQPDIPTLLRLPGCKSNTFFGSQKIFKKLGGPPNNDHVGTWKQKGAFKTSLKLTANAPENRPFQKRSHHPFSGANC